MKLYRYEFDVDMVGVDCDLNEFEKHLQAQFDAARLPLVACAHTTSSNGARKRSRACGVHEEDVEAAWDKALSTFFAKV